MSSDQLTTPLSSELVADLVALAWSTFVGTPVEQIEPMEIHREVVCSSISIGGPWSATLLLYCSTDLAHFCAGTVLGMSDDELTDEDVHDIMGELANIIGGNLKGIMSDADNVWTLSLPVVSNGMQSVPGSRPATELLFLSDGAPLGCKVLEHA